MLRCIEIKQLKYIAKMNVKYIAAGALCLTLSLNAQAFDLKEMLGKLGGSDVITNMIDGVFTTSNIEVKDLAGQWTSSGSAVSFKSENLLKKAGGIAAAAKIESELDPYFKQFGLTGTVFIIQENGQFEMKVKKMTLKGDITKDKDGNFTFAFKALGKKNIGNITAYISKSLSSMNIMFDAGKLQSLMNTLASFTNNKLAKSVSTVLNSYDGLCVGFKLNKTGNVQSSVQQYKPVDSAQAAAFLKGLLVK